MILIVIPRLRQGRFSSLTQLEQSTSHASTLPPCPLHRRLSEKLIVPLTGLSLQIDTEIVCR